MRRRSRNVVGLVWKSFRNPVKTGFLSFVCFNVGQSDGNVLWASQLLGNARLRILSEIPPFLVIISEWSINRDW